MNFKYMQSKIHIAILAIVLATTMITSAGLTLNNAVAQDNGNPFEGITGFFTGEEKPESNATEEQAPVAEEVKPEVAGNESEIVTAVPVDNASEEVTTTVAPECPEPGNATTTPEPVVVPPVDNGTVGNVTEPVAGNETTVTENGTVPEESEIGGNETGVAPGPEDPETGVPVENVTETGAIEEGIEPVMGGDNETVVEPPIDVQVGNETTGENGTVVLPDEVPVIDEGNETSEVIEVVENQTEAVDNQTEAANNVTETPEVEEPQVVETVQIELTKEIGNGFLTLLQVGQFIPSVTPDEVESLQVAAEALQEALSNAVEASGNINIEQSNVGSGDASQSNTAVVG